MTETTQATEGSAPIGHNQPPQESIQERLAREHKDIRERVGELRTDFLKVPDKIEDDETHRQVADLFKAMRLAFTTADSARKIEKEPFVEGGKLVDGWFGSFTRGLKEDRDKLKDRLEAYAEVIAAKERAEREERARQAREEAERKEREAREAEERRLAAERQAKAAEEARLKAQREREAAEQRAREERERAEAAKKRAAEEAKRAKEAEEEAERQAAERRAAEAKREQEEAERRQREERERAQRELENRRKAEEEERAAKQDVKAETKIEKVAMDTALAQEKRAGKFDRSAQAGAADLSRERTDRGVTASLAESWVGRVTDYDKLDLEKLRGFINREALDKAVNLYVKAGGRELRGAHIDTERNIRVV